MNLIRSVTTLARPPQQTRLVTEGRVSCPMMTSGDTDVDSCFSCGALQETFTDTSGNRWIRCR